MEAVDESTLPEVSPAMLDAGYWAYLSVARDLEDGEPADKHLAMTTIFRAMCEAKGSEGARNSSDGEPSRADPK